MDDLSGLDWSKPAGGPPRQPLMNPLNPSPSLSPRPTPPPAALGRSFLAPDQAQAAPQPSKTLPPKQAQDSFSNLMSFGSAKATAKLTLAERQAQLEAEKREKAEEQRKQVEAQFGNGQQWDALGSRAFTPSPSLQQPAHSNSPMPDDDDLFAAFNKDTKVDKSSHYPPPEPKSCTPASGSRLDLASPAAWGPVSDSNSGFPAHDDDPFGLNDLKQGTGATRFPPAAKTVQDDDDDDFLGDLARPVDEVRKKQQAAAQPEPGKPIEDDDSSSSGETPPSRSRAPNRQPRAGGDFDNAMAQLVDYGFAPEDARRALSESGAGFNVQAAANWLLDDAHRKAEEKPQGKSLSAGPKGEPDLAKSAAAVGSSLFKTANSLWKTGQKKMQQAVADFQQEGDPSQPKWMRDGRLQQDGKQSARTIAPQATDEALALEAGGRPRPPRSSSRHDPRLPAEPTRRLSPLSTAGSESRSSSTRRWQQQAPPPAVSNARSRLNRLAADDGDSFSIHVSAGRKKKSPRPPAPDGQGAGPDLLFNADAPKAQSLPHRPAPRDRPSPVRRPQASPTGPRSATRQPARAIPPMDSLALQKSTSHRLEGTAHFKRGDYATAHSSYSASMSSVPPAHPLMIVLLTNRALTALKTGEPKQAVSDADEALRLIGPSSGQGESVAVRGEGGQEEQRDMRELYGKALSRKAEALEQMEKWADAGAVWQRCVEVGVGGPTAVKGRQRCQKALAPKPKAAPRPAARRAASLAPPKNSEAVSRLREANQAAAREDDEKFALSEAVDARVAAWRDGKRDNLRALLGSMDKVLWQGSGWKSVGMHELVMANKVKVAYMKAIAKTHPDKVRGGASPAARRHRG